MLLNPGTLLFCILLCCFGCGRFDYIAVKIEGSLLNIQIYFENSLFCS
jgi:hypothetical protein